MNAIVDKIEAEQFKKEVARFNVGDTVKVHTRVREGDKDRVQVYEGIVIARKGRGIHSKFTVRRISFGEGVERIFPLHSPRVEKVQVVRQGHVRRAKLYYLRDRKGKAAMMVKERKAPQAAGKAAKVAKAAKRPKAE
ncbi:MAG TPA: 50S ribosomal protein L19 [Verrucomicrobiae bacterium]|nr:50S ribosomal protein L19 [Verrucomicrobiae bacterium]